MTRSEVIHIQPPGPAITLNKRLHWRAEAQHKKAWREAAYWSCLASRQGRTTLDGRWLVSFSYPVKSLLVRRDGMNWIRTTKWAIDGMVDAGVFEDDDSKHVVVADATFHTGRPEVIVTLEEL
jgi:crossover junction endodeoxyribonuclease RusA